MFLMYLLIQLHVLDVHNIQEAPRMTGLQGRAYHEVWCMAIGPGDQDE